MKNITFSDRYPDCGQGILLDYLQSMVDVKGWDYVDIRDIISGNEDKWLNDIQRWYSLVQQVLDVKLDKWKLLPVSRLILWETNSGLSLKPIFFVLGVIELTQKSNRDIWILNAPIELIQLLEEWQSGNDVSTKLKFNSVLPLGLYAEIASVIMKYKSRLKCAVKLGFLVLRKKKKEVQRADVLISSLFFSDAITNEFGDHYFGHMIDNINKSLKLDVAWIYGDIMVKPVGGPIIQNRVTYSFQNIIRCSDILYGIIGCIKNISKKNEILKSDLLPTLTFEHFESNLFPKMFYRTTAINYCELTDLIFLRIYKRFIRQSGAKVIIFPYEEHTAEHALLDAAKNFDDDIRCICFAHAGYSKGHLCINRNYSSLLRTADEYWVTGNDAEQRFVSSGIKRETIVKVGSPRHRKSVDLRPLSSKVQTIRRYKLLFICGLGFELIYFAKLAARAGSFLQNYDILIRNHFHSWKKEQKNAEDILSKAGIRHTIVTGDLASQIVASDLVLFESTTAALQASMLGRPIIHMKLFDVLQTNLFFKSKDGVVPSCSTFLELDHLIKQLAVLSETDFRRFLGEQREMAENLFSPLNLPTLKSRLSR